MHFISQAVSRRKTFLLTAILLLAFIGCVPRAQEPLALVSDIFNQSMPAAEATLLYSEKLDHANDKEIPFYSVRGLVGTNLSDSDFTSRYKDLMAKQGWKIMDYTVSGYPVYCKPDYEHVLVRMINGLAFNQLNAPPETIAKAKNDYHSFFMLDVNYFPSTSYAAECK